MISVDLTRLDATFKRLKAKALRDDVDVQVGFAMPYAGIVHEDLEAHHAPGTQAKYLEQPTREYSSEIGRIIRQTYTKTKNLTQSLIMGGLFLQRKAQELVPVDTGALEASAYTATTENATSKAAEALARGMSIYVAAKGIKTLKDLGHKRLFQRNRRKR